MPSPRGRTRTVTYCTKRFHLRNKIFCQRKYVEIAVHYVSAASSTFLFFFSSYPLSACVFAAPLTHRTRKRASRDGRMYIRLQLFRTA